MGVFLFTNMFHLYILYSQKLDGYYIGFTGQTIEHRLQKHLSAKKGHTCKAKDWVIAHSESFETKKEAMAREKQLKSWKSKLRIKQLISKTATE
jgi:putative endonuclease